MKRMHEPCMKCNGKGRMYSYRHEGLGLFSPDSDYMSSERCRSCGGTGKGKLKALIEDI